ncbi:hypothetical protein [Clavibacter sp. CT19]|uniref:hypothetical protein n=1 Tax=unclassified Clavibacter TaxID=2626594 RepID=UPI0022EA445D|nr:hypothetical protein [Clavibacter sp. CT19]MDA3803790.1 hypothetical protein [Clavibacter sp. CT19]
MPAAPAARSGGVRAGSRAGHVVASLAMGVLTRGLALDGSLRRLDEHAPGARA